MRLQSYASIANEYIISKLILMAYNPDIHNRTSIRLKGYDYSQCGFYYVTLCTQDCENRFGEIMDGEIVLNVAGLLVDAEWKRIAEIYDSVILDTYQIMPNHLHGILQITAPNPVGTGLVPVPNFSDEFVDDFLVDKNNISAKTADQNIEPPARMGTRPIPTVGNDDSWSRLPSRPLHPAKWSKPRFISAMSMVMPKMSVNNIPSSFSVISPMTVMSRWAAMRS